MTVPREVMRRMREVVWPLADAADWNQLSAVDKGKLYREWSKDPAIGGVLSQYMDVTRVRPYIKDAVLKVYARRSTSEYSGHLRAVGLSPASKVAKVFIKPHGLLLADGKLVCWARAKTWKQVLMALHERSFADINSVPYGAVMLDSCDGFGDATSRLVVDNAAVKLGVRRVVWV
jgi:hypothetical protein